MATLERASGYLQLKNTDALRRSERSCNNARGAGGPEGGVFLLRGPEEALLPVRRQVASRRVERPPCRRWISVTGRVTPRTGRFCHRGVALSAGGVRAASPQEEYPTPAPHASRAPQRRERSRPHVPHRRRSWLPAPVRSPAYQPTQKRPQRILERRRIHAPRLPQPRRDLRNRSPPVDHRDHTVGEHRRSPQRLPVGQGAGSAPADR